MIRTLDTRIEVLRNGVAHTLLAPEEGTAPTIRMSAGAAIKSSLSGSFVPNPAIDWLKDELRPVAVIDGVEHRFGVFAPATVRPEREDGFGTVSVEAYDRCWRLDTNKTESLLHLSAGTPYLTAIKRLLAGAGLGLVAAVPTSDSLRSDREDWSIGTSYLTIVNALLAEINYNPIWFDSAGAARLEPIKTATATEIVRTYDSSNSKTMMLPRLSAEIDLYNAPNVFVCVCANPDDKSAPPLVATAENRNALSPLSIQRRGTRIVKLIKVNNIASFAALQKYANQQSRASMMLGERIAVSTAILPGCGVGDVVALSHPDVSGVCRETEWTIEFRTGGSMSHRLEKEALEL